MSRMQIYTITSFLLSFLFRLYNLKDHRELGALMQHEGKNWYRFFHYKQHKGRSHNYNFDLTTCTHILITCN